MSTYSRTYGQTIWFMEKTVLLVNILRTKHKQEQFTIERERDSGKRTIIKTDKQLNGQKYRS